MGRPDDEAIYHAVRIRDTYALPDPVTRQDLLRVCEAEGVYRVDRSPAVDEMDALGVYVPWPVPIIVLRADADRWVLAHELYHHLTRQNASVGVTYSYTRRPRCAEEWGARMFSWLLNAPPRRKEGLKGWR